MTGTWWCWVMVGFAWATHSGCPLAPKDPADKSDDVSDDAGDNDDDAGDNDDDAGDDDVGSDDDVIVIDNDDIGDACALGAKVLCVCRDNIPGCSECTPDEVEQAEALCNDGQSYGIVECMSDYVDSQGYVDCDAAIYACLVDASC
jgi:hypothetical protein